MSPPGAAPPGGDAEYVDQQHLSYQGSRIPFVVILIWLVFVIWGLIYLMRWIPKSWQEWFTR